MKAKIYKTGRNRSILNWKNGYRIDRFSTLLKIRDKGNLIATCYLKGEYVYGLVVNPKFRNSGYGKKMLAYAEKVLGKNGYKEMKLIPQDNDDNLRNYYSKLGFTGHDKSEPGYEEEDKEWWIMSKKIGQKKS